MMERGQLEIAPLAYMRGRTLEDSFVILDEAQNTTPEQMKMFLTRLGFGSKMVITGDVTQIDLPRGKQSGLQKLQGDSIVQSRIFNLSTLVKKMSFVIHLYKKLLKRTIKVTPTKNSQLGGEDCYSFWVAASNENEGKK